MNTFLFDLAQMDTSEHQDLAKLFTIVNTMGVNTRFLLKNEFISQIVVDLPFDNPFPSLSAFTEKIVDNSEIETSPDLRTFPYVTVGSVVCVLSTSDAPEADFSRFYRYNVVTDPEGEIFVYVGIANSALTESYAPFGVREGQKPAHIRGMIVTSANALQTMLNNCSCPTINPSTGLSVRDLTSTVRP